MAEENTQSRPSKSQNPLVAVLISIIILGLLGLAFFFGLKFRQAPGGVSPTPTPEITNIPSPQPTSTPEQLTPTPTVKLTPTPTIDETALIKQAVFAKTGLTASQAEVTINKNTGKHATGNIKEFEAVGGAYWIAAKVGETWVGVYAGQSHPTCEEIAPYDFPRDIVSQCLDKNNQIINR